MPAVLAIETSSELCSVALAEGGRVHAETHPGPRSHARVLLPAIEALLDRAGLRPEDLDGIVYGCGPGSFTGLRIGCAAVQGLAWAAELPTLGVSSLAVLAQVARRDGVAAGCGILTVLDARMGEFYLAAWPAASSAVPLLGDRSVTEAGLAAAVTELAAGAPERWIAVGDGAGALAPHLPGLAAVRTELRPDASALLELATSRLAAEGVPATRVRPVYLRDESRWRRQAPRGA